MINFLFGVCIGTFILEPIVINFIYFTNIDLFMDIILTNKNRNKLINHFRKERKKCSR